MALSDYPLELSAKTRETNLDNPANQDKTIQFFLEIRSLLSGRLDRIREKAGNGSPVDIQRVWQFSNPDIQPPTLEPPILISQPSTAHPTNPEPPANTK